VRPELSQGFRAAKGPRDKVERDCLIHRKLDLKIYHFAAPDFDIRARDCAAIEIAELAPFLAGEADKLLLCQRQQAVAPAEPVSERTSFRSASPPDQFGERFFAEFPTRLARSSGNSTS
jgi:hypothetical protein